MAVFSFNLNSHIDFLSKYSKSDTNPSEAEEEEEVEEAEVMDKKTACQEFIGTTTVSRGGSQVHSSFQCLDLRICTCSGLVALLNRKSLP
jgi:hypothetical protein